MHVLKRRHNNNNKPNVISLNNHNTISSTNSDFHEVSNLNICDVIEFKKTNNQEPRNSFYPQYTFLDSSCDTNCSLSARGKRLRSGNSNQRLPPLDSSQELKISGIIQVPANNKQNYHLLQTTAIPLQLPTTANKKRLPEKIQAICSNKNQNNKLDEPPPEDYLKFLNTQRSVRIDADTPLTIDILSESGRTSRFSYLEAITPRDSHSKLPIKSPLKIKLDEDPILVHTTNKHLGNFENNKKALKVNFAALDNRKSALINPKTSVESNNLFVDPNKYSDFQLNMENVNTSKSFQNKTYFLDNKSSMSADFHDYTDNDFIEEYDDTDDKTEEESIRSSSDDCDDDDYNHLSRVHPLKSNSQDNLKASVVNLDSLDTINESLRESNYTFVAKTEATNTDKIQIPEVHSKQLVSPSQHRADNNKQSNLLPQPAIRNKIVGIGACKKPVVDKQALTSVKTNTRSQSNDNKNRINQNDTKKPALNKTITSNCKNQDPIKRSLTRQNTNSSCLMNNKPTPKKETAPRTNPTPSIIETSRLQRSNENSNNVEQVGKSTISNATVLSEVNNSTVQTKKLANSSSNLQSKCQTNSKSNVNNKLPLNQKSLSSHNLEVNSNKISLKTKPPSAKSKKSSNDNTTLNSEPVDKPVLTSENSIDSRTKILKCADSIIEPQPLTIYDMFANFENPFTNQVKSTVPKSASIRSNSASKKCLISTTKPKKSASATRKKAKNGLKKSKTKQKKIIVSKSEINVGYTTEYSIVNGANKDEQVIFMNPPDKDSREENDYNTDIDDGRSINIDNDIDDKDDDDSSSESSDESLSNSNIPIVSIGDINAVAASQSNEIEIDNGESFNGNNQLIDASLAMSNIILIDEDRLKTVSNKVDVLRARLDNVLNASSNDSIRNSDFNSNQNQLNTEAAIDSKLEQKENSKYYASLSLNIDKANCSSHIDTSKDSNSNLTSLRSTKTNVNIRDVYTMVNSLRSKINNNESSLYEKSCQSLNSTLAKQGLPPKIPNRDEKTKTDKNYELPPVLSNKLSSLIEMTSAHNEVIKDDFKKSPLGNYEILTNSNLQQKGRVSRVNYNLSLDSVGSETVKSNNSISDENNTHSYEKTYRNDPANPTSSRTLFEVQDYNEFDYKWKRGMLLGKGAFGMVYQALLSTGAIIAVKQVEMEESDPVKALKEYENIKEEVNILKELDHENIVKFLGTSLEDYIVNIFMEFIPGGTVESLLKTYGPFDEILLKKFTLQIVKGISYIHSNNVVHRDIKGKNIMLMQNGVIKLIDFGCAKRLKKNQSENSMKNLLKSLKGTPYWMAPEVIRETGHGSKADIWSVGCTVFEMATGHPPWHEMKPIAAIYAIGSGDGDPPTLPSHFSDDARDFVQSCLLRDPEERPTALKLLNHPFLTNIESQ